jgi:hypothetical protein
MFLFVGPMQAEMARLLAATPKVRRKMILEDSD